MTSTLKPNKKRFKVVKHIKASKQARAASSITLDECVALFQHTVVEKVIHGVIEFNRAARALHAQYLESSPRAHELTSLLIGNKKQFGNNRTVTYHVLVALLKLASYDAQHTVNTFILQFIGSHAGRALLISVFANGGGTASVLLQLLSALARVDAVRVFRAIDFKAPGVAKLAKSAATRAVYVQLMAALLRCADARLVVSIGALHQPMALVSGGWKKDEYALLDEMFGVLYAALLSDDAIRVRRVERKTQRLYFTNGALLQLIELASLPAEDDRSELALSLLRRLWVEERGILKHSAAIDVSEPLSAPLTREYEAALAAREYVADDAAADDTSSQVRVLLHLDACLDERHAQLLLDTLRAAPELWQTFMHRFDRLGFPNQKAAWRGAARLVERMLSTVPDARLARDEPPPLSCRALVSSVAPPRLSRPLLTRVLNSKHLVVRVHGLTWLSLMLARAERVHVPLQRLAGDTQQSPQRLAAWQRIAAQFSIDVMAILPSVTLVGAQCEWLLKQARLKPDPLHAPALELALNVVNRFFALPHAVSAPAALDCRRLLPRPLSLYGDGVLAQAMALLRARPLAAPVWIERTAKAPQSYARATIDAVCASQSEASDALRVHLRATAMFEANALEIDCWIAALQHAGAAAPFETILIECVSDPTRAALALEEAGGREQPCSVLLAAALAQLDSGSGGGGGGEPWRQCVAFCVALLRVTASALGQQAQLDECVGKLSAKTPLSPFVFEAGESQFARVSAGDASGVSALDASALPLMATFAAHQVSAAVERRASEQELRERLAVVAALVLRAEALQIDSWRACAALFCDNKQVFAHSFENRVVREFLVALATSREFEEHPRAQEFAERMVRELMHKQQRNWQALFGSAVRDLLTRCSSSVCESVLRAVDSSDANVELVRVAVRGLASPAVLFDGAMAKRVLQLDGGAAGDAIDGAFCDLLADSEPTPVKSKRVVKALLKRASNECCVIILHHLVERWGAQKYAHEFANLAPDTALGGLARLMANAPRQEPAWMLHLARGARLRFDERDCVVVKRKLTQWLNESESTAHAAWLRAVIDSGSVDVLQAQILHVCTPKADENVQRQVARFCLQQAAANASERRMLHVAREFVAQFAFECDEALLKSIFAAACDRLHDTEWVCLASAAFDACGDDVPAAVAALAADCHSQLIRAAQFLPSIMPSDNDRDDDLPASRAAVSQLLVVLQRAAGERVEATAARGLARLLTAAYNGTVCAGDQSLLKALQQLEARGAPLLSDEFAFGRVARLQLLGERVPSSASLFIERVTSEDMFESERMHRSATLFPMARHLRVSAATGACCLKKRESIGFADDTVYDPALVLPLLVHAAHAADQAAGASPLDIARFVQQGALAYCVAALSSECRSVRQLAMRVLGPVRLLLDSRCKAFVGREQVSRTLSQLRQSIVSDRTRLPTTLTAFVRGAIDAYVQEQKHATRLLNAALRDKVLLPLDRIPAFELFVDGNRQQQAWLLRWMGSGVATHAADLTTLQNHNAVQRALLLRELTRDTRTHVLAMLSSIARFREGAEYLLWQAGVLAWLTAELLMLTTLENVRNETSLLATVRLRDKQTSSPLDSLLALFSRLLRSLARGSKLESAQKAALERTLRIALKVVARNERDGTLTNKERDALAEIKNALEKIKIDL